MRVVHCYGQTPARQEAIDAFYAQRRDSGAQGEPPEYDRYEKGRDWQPTTCGRRAAAVDVVSPSDFAALVNHTNPDVDMDTLDGTGYEALPYQDGTAPLDAEPCGSCKEAAPLSWSFLFYAGDEDPHAHGAADGLS